MTGFRAGPHVPRNNLHSGRLHESEGEQARNISEGSVTRWRGTDAPRCTRGVVDYSNLH
jgi:hypothetical protein